MHPFFGREFYIRLSDDYEGFVYTTRYGNVYRRVKKFLLSEPTREAAKENESVPARKRSWRQTLSLLQTDSDSLGED